MQLPGLILQGGRFQPEGNPESRITGNMQVAHPGSVAGDEILQLVG